MPYRRVILRGVLGVFILIGILFGFAGRWNFWQGWAILGGTMAYMAAILILFRNKMDLIRERIKPGPGTKWWDKVFFAVYAPLSYAIVIVGSLDAGRFGWTDSFPWWGYGIGYFLYIGSLCLILWAMWVNNFFSSTVRIQTDRGHSVCQDGPYAYIRHPGYAFAMVLMVGLALCLGSLYALIPAAGVWAAIIVRTGLEDAVLHNELPGYKEYAEKVRWRLLRGIW